MISGLEEALSNWIILCITETLVINYFGMTVVVRHGPTPTPATGFSDTVLSMAFSTDTSKWMCSSTIS